MNPSVENLTQDDLRRHTNQMIDYMLGLIADCRDADVTFLPVDPEANDTFAANAAEVNLSWTLAHVIVHATASAEEAAFIATELARGVPYHGRSRYEEPWQTVTTIKQCRARLEESRRMRLASLDAWPNPPHLENTYSVERYPEPINAIRRFAMGLGHDESHLEQIKNIVQQTTAARN
jgi:DinB superfamily